MRLGTFLFRLVVVLLVVAGAAQWWLLERAEFEAQRVIEQWRGYGEITYDRLWVNLWGSGSLEDVSFAPNGLTQAMLGTPLGYRITIRELRFRRPEFDEDGTLSRARLTLSDLRLPVEDGYRLRGNNAPPSPAELGYKSFELDGALNLRLIEDAGLVLLDGRLVGSDVGALRFQLQLDSTLRQLRLAPDQVGLRKLWVQYEDHGMMQRYLRYTASRAGVSLEQAPQLLTAALDRRVAKEKWKWDAASAASLRGFIREPGYCSVLLDPPGQVILRNIPLYAVADWPQLLGFTFSNQRAAAP